MIYIKEQYTESSGTSDHNKSMSNKSMNKVRKLMTNSHDHQAKKHSIYLKISIKTVNLLIFALCTNFIAFIRYVARLPSWFFLFIILCDYVAMYLSFAFVSHRYRCLFSPFKNICYSLCSEVMYSLCGLNKIHTDLKLKVTVSNNSNLPNQLRPQFKGMISSNTINTKTSFEIPNKLSIDAVTTMSNSILSNTSNISHGEHNGTIELPDMIKCDSNSDAEPEEMDMDGIVIVCRMETIDGADQIQQESNDEMDDDDQEEIP